MKIFQKIIIFLFIAQIFFHSFIMIFLNDNLSVSVNEKRELEPFPKLSLDSYLNGGFMKGFEGYLNDHFAFRKEYIDFSAKASKYYYIDIKETHLVKKIFDKKENNKAIKNENIEENIELETNDNTKLDTSLFDIPNYNEEIEIDPILVKNGVLVLNNSRLAERYQFSQEETDVFIDAVNKLYIDCGSPNTYIMLPFQSSHYYLSKKFVNEKNDQNLALKYITERIIGPKVIEIDKEMKKHSNEHIFFLMDHHWTGLGAYYAYKEFLSEIGDEAKPLEEYETGFKYGFKGSLYNSVLQTPEASIFENVYDTVNYFVPKYNSEVYIYNDTSMTNPKKIKLINEEYSKDEHLYSIFLNGDSPLTYIHSENQNGKSICVLKDSYGNSFVPYLTDNYEHIYAIDARFFNEENKPNLKLATFFKNKNIDDLMILNYFNFVSSEYWMHIGPLYQKMGL